MRIGLLDHMGYGNLGDAATQDALIANIRKRVPDVVFIAFSLNPDDTQQRHQIPCYPIKRWHPGLMNKRVESSGDAAAESRPQQPAGWKTFLKRIPILGSAAMAARDFVDEIRHIVQSFRVLRSLDSLMLSGGGQLGDLWRGPWQHPYNVFKFAVLAKLAGTKLIFINVGAGPLRHPLSQFFVKSAVRLADYASFRDVESRDLLRRLGVNDPGFVFPDSVYALDMPAPSAGPHASARPIVGINPIGFADPRIWPRADQALYSDYLDKLTTMAFWLVEQGYDLKVFSAEASVDVYAIEDLKQRLLERLPAATVDRFVNAPSRQVADLVREMATFDYVITSKFHGVVFSHLLGKPVIALSYHNKIDDLMRATGHYEYCIGVEQFSVAQLQERFGALVGDAQRLKTAFRSVSASHAEALRGQFDRVFVPEYLAG